MRAEGTPLLSIPPVLAKSRADRCMHTRTALGLSDLAGIERDLSLTCAYTLYSTSGSRVSLADAAALHGLLPNQEAPPAAQPLGRAASAGHQAPEPNLLKGAQPPPGGGDVSIIIEGSGNSGKVTRFRVSRSSGCAAVLPRTVK